LNTSQKAAKHTDETNLDVMVRLVEAMLAAKTTKLLVIEDVVGTFVRSECRLICA
jgi:hypothetical protein